MFVIEHKKIFISISSALVLLAVISLFTFPLNFGIDFKGGALTEVRYAEERPALSEVESAVRALGFGQVLVQPAGESGFIIKTPALDEGGHDILLQVLSFGREGYLEETSFNTIGPSVGRELSRKAAISVSVVALSIVLFIAFAFRGVSRFGSVEAGVPSWKYGVVAVAALLHDVLIPVGLFAVFGRLYGVEIDTLFVVGVLTILGLSVSDTIVIFDRIRENLKIRTGAESFADVVGKSLGQSYLRSLFTSLSVIIVLLSLFFLGPQSTKHFALLLTAGIFFGTYSSIFLASPLLVLVHDIETKRAKK